MTKEQTLASGCGNDSVNNNKNERWIKPPSTGLESNCGMSRGKLYALALAGKIRSVSLKDDGKTRGTRLYHLGSILEYITNAEGK